MLIAVLVLCLVADFMSALTLFLVLQLVSQVNEGRGKGRRDEADS